MSRFVERTCTVVEDGTDGTREAESRPLAEFRDCSAYVLLGAPGAGKTEAFKHEAENEASCDARDFMTLDHKRWAGVRTLFIDGPDEVRAGTVDGRSQLDAMRGRLDRLGRPRFRLSCREADWFYAADRKRLESVSPDGAVKVLRLDPLSEDNIRDILDDEGVEDIEHFISEARNRGLGALLPNPQTLKLLKAAVTDGDWPATRTGTFEAACSTLIHELNEEHLQAVPQLADSEMLHTAGHLCAVQLLSGQVGYRLPIRTDNVDGYIDLRDIQEPTQETLLVTLHTKVFDVTDGLAKPIHQHIAEFLAGRYLSALIEDGLPVRRVLALLAGDDGRTVSEFRGLAAWLATHSHTARQDVIEHDPLGTVLYGDVKMFSVDEKRRLLDLLERDAERDPRVFTAMHDLDSRWEGLATSNMEHTFREILTATGGSQGRQTVAFAVLRSLERGAVIPRLVPMLLDLVRDGKCWSSVREAALEAYIQQSSNGDTADHELTTLLADVYAGSVADPDDQLLGLLLMRLFPGTLPPAEVGRFLRERKRQSLIGRYVYFWEDALAERATDDQFADALDSILGTRVHGALAVADGESSSYWLREIPATLLTAYLKRSPTVSQERLFEWLGRVAADASHDAEAKISAWLTNNPDSYKAVVRLAADHYPHSSELRHEIYSRLFLAFEPSDFGEWCLAQAAKTTTNTPAASEFFLERVVALQEEEQISGPTAERRMEHEPTLLAEYKRLRNRRDRSHSRRAAEQTAWEQRRQERETERRQRRKDWCTLVETHKAALRENRALPALLDRLASAYLGRYWELQGDTGRDRLRDLLGRDDLIDTVVDAFRKTPMRKDLPDEIGIVCLAEEQKHHRLMLPFLVGLDETRHQGLRVGEPPLDELGMRRALAFRFQEPDLWRQEPCWYRPMLASHPDVVADVFVRSVRTSLRRGAADGLGLYELGHDAGHRPVARLTLRPLLDLFPVRCKVEQLNNLKLLLYAALRYLDKEVLIRTVKRKLSLRSMHTAQRVYWLCTGLRLAPASFTGKLKQALAGTQAEQRIRHMAQFFLDADHTFVEALDSSASELLIRSLGSSYRPLWVSKGTVNVTTVTATTRTSTYTPLFVDALIDVLASDPSNTAATALESLSQNPVLKPWHVKLQDARSRQREIRREANFRHPTVAQVLETLDNRRPANAADLAALTKQLLCGLARDIRHGNTSDWRQYWNVDSYNRAQAPKPEGACRDALLSDLKTRLAPVGVDAQPEGIYTHDKRADIRVWCDGFNVPIEIKNSSHDDLWRAIRNQLIAKYTRDLNTGGYGIYLVFWFGRDRCKRPPTEPVPETPAALGDQLLATADLSPEERGKISVIVIDVSKPDPQSGSMSS